MVVGEVLHGVGHAQRAQRARHLAMKLRNAAKGVGGWGGEQAAEPA